MEKYLPDRVDTLRKLSGLHVTVRVEKNGNVYEFYNDGQAVKSCFTYDKAKLFAEGINFGRQFQRWGS